MVGKRDAPPDGADGALVKRQRTEANELVVSTGAPDAKKDISRTSDLKAPIMQLEGHGAEVYTCKFSADGDLFASAGHDKSIFLWRTWGDCENFAALQGHKSAIVELHWSDDSEKIVSASPDKSVRAWDIPHGVQIKKMAEHTDHVNSCALLRKGSPLVVSGSDDRTVKIWDLRSKKSVQTIEDAYQVLSVCFGGAGDQVYSGGIDNTVKVWDLRKEAVSITLTGHSDSVTGMSLSPDGNFLLTNSMDNTMRVWDVRPYAPANRCTQLFSGHSHNFEKNLLKCAWSPDGNRITCGSADQLVYVWDVVENKMLYRLPGHKGSVNEAVFHPIQPIIASASSDRTVFMGELA